MAVLSTDDDSRSGGGDERFKAAREITKEATIDNAIERWLREDESYIFWKKTNKMHIEKENILSRLRRGIFKIFDSKG
ncbi:hypothetical protein V6N11_045196 [Hibiscus sabdariffa]|uniref:Uncharacterized protein n=1 Tax=Hibiscus sabdariffa TaxID=183260 RepID=A0ABR2NEN7_9ROSI